MREHGRNPHGPDAIHRVQDTPKVRAIEGEQVNATGPREPANGSRVGDGPMLPELLAQIPPEEPIGLVTADGA